MIKPNELNAEIILAVVNAKFADYCELRRMNSQFHDNNYDSIMQMRNKLSFEIGGLMGTLQFINEEYKNIFTREVFEAMGCL